MKNQLTTFVLIIACALAQAQTGRFAFKNSGGSGSSGQLSDSTNVIPIGSHLRTKGIGKYLTVGRVATTGQASRGWLNVYGMNDTLAAFIGDGNRQVGDSSVTITQKGTVLIKVTSEMASDAVLSLPGGTYFSSSGALRLEYIENYSSGTVFRIYGGGAYGGGVSMSMGGGNKVKRGFWFMNTNGDTAATIYVGSNNPDLGRLVIGKKIKPAVMDQAWLTVRSMASSDTVVMFRNDKNATLDSTAMVFANGDGYFGGNSIYIGGHRIRSNAAGDSLIFYDGNTMIFAILSDGSTADLVAGTAPMFRGIPPLEYRILLWTIAVLLFVLVSWKVAEYADRVAGWRGKFVDIVRQR